MRFFTFSLNLIWHMRWKLKLIKHWLLQLPFPPIVVSLSSYRHDPIEWPVWVPQMHSLRIDCSFSEWWPLSNVTRWHSWQTAKLTDWWTVDRLVGISHWVPQWQDPKFFIINVNDGKKKLVNVVVNRTASVWSDQTFVFPNDQIHSDPCSAYPFDYWRPEKYRLWTWNGTKQISIFNTNLT